MKNYTNNAAPTLLHIIRPRRLRLLSVAVAALAVSYFPGHAFSCQNPASVSSAVATREASAAACMSAFCSLMSSASSLQVYAVSETVSFNANGGTGSMDSVVLEAGKDKLPACTFTRHGYVFRGWVTNPNADTCEYEDQETYPEDAGSMTLYALWEPQMYIIHYAGNGATLGEMDDSYGIYDEKTMLSGNLFVNPGHVFRNWIDTNTGKTYTNMDTVLNLHSGNTQSRAVLTVDAGKPENTDYSFKSTQGSCVYEENGTMYLVTAASINDSAYNNGDLSHYETILTKYELSTGKVVKAVRNLQFDHGNGICYNENNGHLYIAEGGTCDGYPSGVMELDENLEEVREYNFPLLTHIWAIAYADHHFYLIGRNSGSRNSFCVLNDDMETLSITPVDEYYQNFSSQGIASDGSFIYAVSACFKAYDWKTKQRINVFTTKGEYIGVWTIDIPYEAEDLTIVGPYAYISTNEKNKCTLYRTRIPAVTLTATWK